MRGGFRNADPRDDKRTALVAVLFLVATVEIGWRAFVRQSAQRILGGHTIYFGSKARLVSRGGVLVKDAFLNRSVDQRDCLS